MSLAQERQGPPQHRIELPKPDQDNQAATRVLQDGYHLNVANQIGEGAYGQVFTGDCRRTHKKVAVKKIKLENEKEGFPITAVREIKILSSLCHENIVNLREIVRSEVHKSNNFRGSVYMVFDYAEHDLSGLLDTHRFKFTEPQIKCIMKQLLRGLAYVHGNGVLHRDLKAPNILVDKEGVVKLADFGLARTFQQQHGQPTGNLTPRVITLWYRPPELLLECSKYGPEVDIWSVGCIFAELLVGTPIFPGRDEPDQLDRIFRIMGTPNRDNWPGVEELRSWHMVRSRHPSGGQGLKNWLFERANKQGMRPPHPAAIDLIENLLRLDPTKRLNALEAFKHPWFWTCDPPACAPKDLPVTGSSHEYTVKKRNREQEETRRQQGGHQDKRARPQQQQHVNPQTAGQTAGYNNASLPRQQGISHWSPGQMGPGQWVPYQSSAYRHAAHPPTRMPPATQPPQQVRGPMPPPGAPPAPGSSSQQVPYRRSTQGSRWEPRR